jgi:hypothetical protein
MSRSQIIALPLPRPNYQHMFNNLDGDWHVDLGYISGTYTSIIDKINRIFYS